MYNEKQKKEMLKLLDNESKTKEFILNKAKEIDSFKIKSDKLADGWNNIIHSYIEILKKNEKLFSDPQKVADGLYTTMDLGGKYLDDATKFNDNYALFVNNLKTYIKDQGDLGKEIFEYKNLEKNIFTYKSNQVMRLKNLKIRIDELFNESKLLDI
jgi:hypothetical protein